jgi:hypothetical protein
VAHSYGVQIQPVKWGSTIQYSVKEQEHKNNQHNQDDELDVGCLGCFILVQELATRLIHSFRKPISTAEQIPTIPKALQSLPRHVQDNEIQVKEDKDRLQRTTESCERENQKLMTKVQDLSPLPQDDPPPSRLPVVYNHMSITAGITCNRCEKHCPTIQQYFLHREERNCKQKKLAKSTA